MADHAKSAKPVQEASLGGSLALVVVYVANALGADMSAEVGAAIAALAVYAAGYLRRR